VLRQHLRLLIGRLDQAIADAAVFGAFGSIKWIVRLFAHRRSCSRPRTCVGGGTHRNALGAGRDWFQAELTCLESGSMNFSPTHQRQTEQLAGAVCDTGVVRRLLVANPSSSGWCGLEDQAGS